MQPDGFFLFNTALTPGESAGILELASLVDLASEAIAAGTGDKEFIASGWPRRIRPHAQLLLDAMVARGRFSKDRAGGEPAT